MRKLIIAITLATIAFNVSAEMTDVVWRNAKDGSVSTHWESTQLDTNYFVNVTDSSFKIVAMAIHYKTYPEWCLDSIETLDIEGQKIGINTKVDGFKCIREVKSQAGVDFIVGKFKTQNEVIWNITDSISTKGFIKAWTNQGKEEVIL
jgi:hypothetical protein